MVLISVEGITIEVGSQLAELLLKTKSIHSYIKTVKKKTIKFDHKLTENFFNK